MVRVYTSDDHGRSWNASDGWIMGWREGPEKRTDSFVEATGVELSDGDQDNDSTTPTACGRAVAGAPERRAGVWPAPGRSGGRNVSADPGPALGSPGGPVGNQ